MLTRDLLMTSTLLLAVGAASAQNNHAFRPEIPRVWDERALKEMELPVVMPKYSPKPVSAEYYYRIPVRTIYKSYPIYAPGRTPSGYLDRLKTLEPEIAFDRARLKTKDDWIRAGEIVFEAPTEVDEDGPFAKAVSDPLPNPKSADKQLIAAGKKIFEREGCAGCHTPPLYTNNKLTPAQGFSVPADHRSKYDILPVVIGTDPRLTMERGGARATTRCLHCVAYGIAGHSSITAR